MSKNHRILPLNELSDINREKTIKVGMRRYEYCPYTLQRIIDIEQAYYDAKTDQMFIDKKSYFAWLDENSKNKTLKQKEKYLKPKAKRGISVNLFKKRKKKKVPAQV